MRVDNEGRTVIYSKEWGVRLRYGSLKMERNFASIKYQGHVLQKKLTILIKPLLKPIKDGRELFLGEIFGLGFG